MSAAAQVRNDAVPSSEAPQGVRSPRKTTGKSRARTASPALSWPTETAARGAGFLRRLGLFGYDRVEPVVLAALASGDPLLLIGPHGTAKSLLLLRLGEALGLQTRHYNASLLNYEDLAGYPLPDATGGLQFIQTPASIWGAEAVFLDEISRCRIDMQNRLFPVIHERRVQGILLDRLRYRWAAMNPPPPADDLDAALYRGSEKLDTALADRFAFVLETPSWASLVDEDRDAVISSSDAPVSPVVAAEVRALVASADARRADVEARYGNGLVDYVRTAMGLLAQSKLELSPRRAAIVYRNAIAAIAAAEVLQGAATDAGEVLHLVLASSLPQRAEGKAVPALTVLTCHREALKLLEPALDETRRRLLSEVSPLRRALLATQCAELETVEFSAFLADALAEAPPGARHALAVHLFESGQAARLGAAVADQAAQLYAHAAVAQDVSETLASGSPRHLVWQELVRVLATLPPGTRDSDLVGNVLGALFASGQLTQPDEAGRVVEAWSEAWKIVGEVLP